MSVEQREEERRYDEAAGKARTVLSSKVLLHPVRTLELQPAVTVSPDDSVAHASRALRDGPHGCVVALDAGRLVGILTETDIVERVVAAGKDPARATMREMMTPEPATLHAEDSIGFALHKMAVGNYRHLPVLDDSGELVGLVRQREAVRYLASYFPAEILNQPPRSFDEKPPASQHGG